MSRVFFDTNLFVYLFEQNPAYYNDVVNLLAQMNRRNDEIVTSWMTLAEVQIKPRMLGDVALCEQYRTTLRHMVTIVPFDEQAADAYVTVRATTSVKGPDAIQLACAASAGVDVFITNDFRLQRLTVQGIQTFVPLGQALL